MNYLGDIPSIGLGLWKVTNEREFNTAFLAAIDAGYTHFDTAQIYRNEQLLGKAWKSKNLSRESLFITTKISVTNIGHDNALKSFETSLSKLQTNYVDLLLLHFPVPLFRKSSWAALEELYESGKAKKIGVSNYTIRHLEQMKRYAKVMPQVNQVELHVFLQQPELVEYCRRENIQLEAYSPLAHGKRMNDKVVKEIADKHNVSYAQVMLRWCLEQGFIVIPKSVKPERIKENIEIASFALDEEDMLRLADLDSEMRTCWDPTLVP